MCNGLMLEPNNSEGNMINRWIGTLGRGWFECVGIVSIRLATPAVAVCALIGLLAGPGCRSSTTPAFSEVAPGEGAGSTPTVGMVKAPTQQEAGAIAKKSKSPNEPGKGATGEGEALVLREGDVVRVSFPGAPNLNTVAAIRRDGKVSLPLVGEVQAAGARPSELEQELIKLYGPQLQVKEITVALESSAFPIYVSGCVLRPGKIMSDRPISALEAIMEAGGFDHTKANLKAVKVIRHGANGQVEHHKLNLKQVLQGEQNEPYMLKPFDIIYVPERFSWF